MTRRPLAPATQQSLFEESIRPDGGTRVFKSAREFAGEEPKKKNYKRRDFSSTATRLVEETTEIIALAQASDEPGLVWTKADSRHLVALYAIFHREVYGVLPGEIAGDWQAACSAAAKLLKDEFDGEVVRCVEYLRWAFAKERKDEKRRGESTWRLGWRWCFLKRELLTNYEVAIQRQLRKHS